MKNSNYFFGLAKYWWMPLISGLIFIGFGIWCLCDPSQSLPILAYIFAGAIGLVGIINVCFGLYNASSYHGWGWATAGGIVEILFSILLFFIPTNALTVIFVYGIGVYIIFMAIYSFFDSFMMSKNSSIGYAWILILLLAAVAFALIFILGPGAPGLIGWIWIGISFICYGTYRILLSCVIREINNKLN